MLKLFKSDKKKNMEIYLVSASGEGKTELSAFDNALANCGVLNYNLIRLSSVIPPNTEIIQVDKYHTPDSDWGHKLYCVQAEMRSSKKGEALACGIGSYMIEGENKGVFVEHETKGGTDEEFVRNKVEKDIKASLSDLCLHRNIPYDESKVGTIITSAIAGDRPTCVLALAIYKAEDWA